MAFHETLFSSFGSLGSFFGSNLSYIAGIIGGIVVLLVIIWLSSKVSSHRNLWGTGLGREVDERAGLGTFRRALRGTLRAGLIVTGSTIPLVKALWAKVKSIKGSGAEALAEQGAAKGAEATEEAEKAGVALEAIKGRALDLIAGLKLVEESLERYTRREESENRAEEKEVEFIENLGEQIAKLSNYDKIDNSVLAYLRKLMSELAGNLENEAKIKKAKKSDVKNLVLALRMAIDEMKSVLKEAKAEEGAFKKFEKKVRKDYSADVRKVKDSLKGREKNLKDAKSKGRNADQNLISTLEKEIEMIRRQYNTANNLNKQLKITFDMIKKEVRQSRKVIKRLQKYDKQMKSVDKILEKTASQLEKILEQCIASAKKLEETLKAFGTNNDAYTVALSVSGSLNEFIKENEQQAELAAEFDKLLKGIVSVGYSMARLTVAYEQLIDGLTQAEETVDQGLDVLIKIMQSVVTDSEVQVDEQQISANMERLNKMLDNQRGIDIYLKNLANVIKYKLNVLFSLIERLANEELQLAALLQRYSGYIGRMIATAFNKKIEIDKNYMGQAETFERVLQQRNEVAYAAYKEGRAA